MKIPLISKKKQIKVEKDEKTTKKKMFRKRFFVKLELQLHAITCPGVWLCKHGFLEATIKTLGYILRTGAMEPRFPLLAHDQFTIEGYFKSVGSMHELERILAAEKVEITLWQSGRRLAYFVGKLADIMHADMLPKLSCEHNINVQLLMKATPAFPGILAPKVELSANVGIRDRLDSSNKNRCTTSVRSASYCGDFVAPNFQSKVTPRKNRHLITNCSDYLEPQRRRQLPVCHTRHFSAESSSSEKSSLPRCGSVLTSPNNYTFEANAINHKNTQRRLSDSSGQSFVISRCSSSFSVDSSVNCTHTWNSDLSRRDAKIDDHQDFCEICQSYQRAFMGTKI